MNMKDTLEQHNNIKQEEEYEILELLNFFIFFFLFFLFFFFNFVVVVQVVLKPFNLNYDLETTHQFCWCVIHPEQVQVQSKI